MSAQPSPKTARPIEIALLAIVVSALLWSGISPHDRLTWFFETAPVWIAIPLLAITYRRFRFTTLVYTLIALHCVLLCVGGHYTYTRVPLFNWLKDVADLSRNHYDRVGHLAQGFVPAMIAREIFIRLNVVNGRRWRSALVIALSLSVSLLYELAEYAAALIYGGRADEFLAIQGDVWDTQADMSMALLGALLALFSLSHYHDRQLACRFGTEFG